MTADSPTRPDVSVAILSWNAREYLRRCLASIFTPEEGTVREAWERAGLPLAEGGTAPTAFEVLVVDQDSLDGSAEMVEEQFPAAKLLRQRPNIGFAGGNNLAFRHSTGRYFVLLNSDTVIRPGWLTELVAYADSHPRVGLLGPKLLNPDGTLQYSCRRFPSLGAGLFRHTPLEWLAPRNSYTQDYLMKEWDHASPREVDWLSGACLMARREMIEEIGGLDEGYFMYFEDVDWAARAHESGWGVHYLPGPVVLHEIGRSSDRRPKRMIVMHHESAYRYFCAHSRLGKSHPGRVLLAAGLAARAVLTLARNEVFRWRGELTAGKEQRGPAS